MGKLKDKIYRNLKIAAIATIGLFGSSQAKAQDSSPDDGPLNPTEVKTDAMNDIIDFGEPTARFVHQVDTVYDAEIAKQIDEGTYTGSMAHFDFQSNTIVKNYFAGIKNQPSQETSAATDVHEEAHKQYANTYGEPIGIVSPKQAYCIEFAKEFNGYASETIYQMNESVKVDSVIGMVHPTNYDFGEMMAQDLGLKYKSEHQQDVEEVLEALTNSVFYNTYQMMISSPLYEQQLLDAAKYNSDVHGVPDDIRQQNYERAIYNAFSITAKDADGLPIVINLYDYLSDENKELLNTVAPQHQEALAAINAENDALIAQNTAERTAQWEVEAEAIAAQDGISVAEAMAELQQEFIFDSQNFTFPSAPQYQQNDAEHHVSEAITPQQYDDYFHLAPDYYAYIATQQNDDAAGNDLALSHARQQLQNLQERKGENTATTAETSTHVSSSRTAQMNYSAPNSTLER